MNKASNYHSLFDSEIAILQQNACRCDDWNRIKASAEFDPARCVGVVFSGDVTLGDLSGSYTDKTGVTVKCVISNAHIHNCTIGSNVLIVNVGDYIANYDIEDNVDKKNCGKIYTEGTSSFGNGTEVAVLNETGGGLLRYGISCQLTRLISLHSTDTGKRLSGTLKT
jgi:hypothetical protein